MKKWVLTIFIALLLCGCSAKTEGSIKYEDPLIGEWRATEFGYYYSFGEDGTFYNAPTLDAAESKDTYYSGTYTMIKGDEAANTIVANYTLTVEELAEKAEEITVEDHDKMYVIMVSPKEYVLNTEKQEVTSVETMWMFFMDESNDTGILVNAEMPGPIYLERIEK